MSVDELIEKLRALPPEVRALPVFTHETGSIAPADAVERWYSMDGDGERPPCVWIGS